MNAKTDTRILPGMSSEKHSLLWANLLYILILAVSWLVVWSPPGEAQAGGAPAMNPAVGLFVAQVGLILLPTLLFVGLARKPIQSTLNLRGLPLSGGVKCWLVGITGWPAAVFLGLLGQLLVNRVFPAAGSPGSSPDLALTTVLGLFIGITLVAPLCEEVLFRGLLLSAYRERFGPGAIWLVGVLFALLHLAAADWLGAFFVGVTAGWVVLRTRSLWAGILVHTGNNLVAGSMMLLTYFASMSGLEGADPAAAGPSQLVLGLLIWGGIALIALVAWFFLLRSLSNSQAISTG